MRRRFNDDYYCQTIEKFEDKTFMARYWDAFFTWALALLWPVVIVGIAVAGSDWRKWIAVIGTGYLFLQVYLFLHELNENIRFVRHQVRTFRHAIHKVQEELGQHQHKENFSVADALESLDRHWELP